MPPSVPISELRTAAEVESCLRPARPGLTCVTSSRTAPYGYAGACGHNVSEQVLRPFGCALAIPAHPEDLLRSSNVDADPLMGFEQRDRGRQTYPARVAAQG